MRFIDLINNVEICEGLKKQNITEPTDIQREVYIPFTEGIDIIARSETGSGKTLAYLIPLFSKINPELKCNQSLILVPTYELAVQVHKQAELLAANSGLSITSAVIIGNGNISRQVETLKSKPCIVVGTAGRIHELIQKKKISAHTVKTLVIDEADKMLDKNNIESVLAVRKCLMRDTQVTLFSASMNNRTISSAGKITKAAKIIKLSDKNRIPDNIEHIFIMVPSKRDKINALRSLCQALEKKNALIFINTQYDIEQAHERLKFHHYDVKLLCGSIDKLQRKNAIESFKNGKLRYLIATDIASRGLHIEGTETVINITIPENPMDYLHRAGRCGRNLKYGQCISIITPSELKKIKSYKSAFNIDFIEKKLENGKMI